MFRLTLRAAAAVAVVLLLNAALPNVHAQVSAPFRVYLTFEDGPTRAYTPQILDILAEYDAKATFFVNGWQIAGKEDILQRILREGHALGNHLWQEVGYYAGTPDEKVIAAYYETEAAIRAALGTDVLPLYDAQPKLFRQPGGGGHALILPEGEPVISYNWNVDGDDCGFRLPESVDPNNFDQFVLDNVLGVPHPPDHLYNAYDYGDGVIIVLHDINRVTGRVLPVILKELQAAGATFLALPRPGDQPNTQPVALGVPPGH